MVHNGEQDQSRVTIPPTPPRAFALRLRSWHHQSPLLPNRQWQMPPIKLSISEFPAVT